VTTSHPELLVAGRAWPHRGGASTRAQSTGRVSADDQHVIYGDAPAIDDDGHYMNDKVAWQAGRQLNSSAVKNTTTRQYDGT
jgi:hypothetical protein